MYRPDSTELQENMPLAEKCSLSSLPRHERWKRAKVETEAISRTLHINDYNIVQRRIWAAWEL